MKEASSEEIEGITIDDFENVLGAAFLNLDPSSLDTVIGSHYDAVDCKNGFYLNVSNAFLLPHHVENIIETLTNYLKEKNLTDDHYVSLTMSNPSGIVATLPFPGKSKSKFFPNSRQTLLWRKDG